MLFKSRIAVLLAVAALSACQRDTEDLARLWSGQTADAVRVGRAEAAAIQASSPLR
jgi:hypothetical protein